MHNSGTNPLEVDFAPGDTATVTVTVAVSGGKEEVVEEEEGDADTGAPVL